MDGWNLDKLENVLDVLDEIYNLTYEIRNCRRGVYTEAETYGELGNYIAQLAERLGTEAEDIKNLPEDEEEEEEEGYEDPDFS